MPPPFAVRVQTASGWQDIAIQGATGAKGDQGVKGDPGNQGIPGGTMGACSFRQTASVAPGAGSTGWRTLWIGSSNVIDPPGSFTRNADGSVTITDTGWYSVSGTVVNQTGTALMSLALTNTLNDQGTYFALESDNTQNGYYRSIAGDNYFTAGQKVYINAWTDTSVIITVTAFQISRIGGPTGQMEVYAQPDEPPVGAKVGAIWIDTDEAPPSGGSLPPGGTAGQTLTKTSATNFAANWQTPTLPITGKTYTMSGYAADRILNCGATSMNEIASVLATLIDDMKAAGLIK